MVLLVWIGLTISMLSYIGMICVMAVLSYEVIQQSNLIDSSYKQVTANEGTRSAPFSSLHLMSVRSRRAGP